MTTNNPQKRNRATSHQLNVMVDYMLETPGLSSGNFQKLHGKYEYEKKWNELAKKLNSLEGANKTATQWYTVWRDLKFRTRIKVRNRRKHRVGNPQGPITALDKRVMDVIGKNCKDRYEPIIQQIKIEEELQLEGEIEDKSNNCEISSPLHSPETEFVLNISDPLLSPKTESSPKRKPKEEDCDIWSKFLEISKIQADALKMIAESNVASLEIAKTHASVLKLSSSEMSSEQAQCSKENLKYFAQQVNSKCQGCDELSKKFHAYKDVAEKRYNTLLDILAEQKVLLNRIVTQNEYMLDIFPITSEDKLKEFDSILVTQLDPFKKQIKLLLGCNVERNLHKILGQEIIMNFNVDGAAGKKRLKDYGNAYTTLIDVISTFNESAEKMLRSALQRQKKKFFKQNSRNKMKNNKDDDSSEIEILAECSATNIDVNIKMTDAIKTLGEGLKHVANAFNVL